MSSSISQQEDDNVDNNIILQDIEEIYNRGINWEIFRDSTILITGAYGMLASYVMYMLIFLNEKQNMNINIIAVVKSKDKFEKRFRSYCHKKYVSIITDTLLNPIVIKKEIDYIIHAASLASPQYYDTFPVDVLSPNVIGTYHLLNLAAQKKVKGFLLFSSGDVYGVVKGIEYVEENNYGIVDPLDIHSCYSESKRMAETMCNSFMHQFGVPVKILRIWHTYSPTMDIEKDPRVFSSFMKNVIKGQDIEIKSDGLSKRTFCYVADTIAGLFYILAKGKDGEAYNICNTDQFVSIRELALILSKLRSDINIGVTWRKRGISEHYTENTAIGQIAPNNEKLRALGWEAKYDIQTGFRRVLSYYSDGKF